MFAVCMMFAAGTVGDHWIESGTHPVYNARIKPAGMGGLPRPTDETAVRPVVVPPGLTEQQKQRVVETCASWRDLLTSQNERLVRELNNPDPDDEVIRQIDRIRELVKDMLTQYDGDLMRHPELEARIEEAQLKMRLRKE